MGKNLKKFLAAAIIFIAISATAYFVAPDTAGTEAGKWYSILPPVAAIILAFLTKKVLFSLGFAIVFAGFLPPVQPAVSKIPPLVQPFARTISYLTGSLFSIENLWILGFIVIIFVMIEILAASGGFAGVVKLMTRFIKGPKSAQFITALLGVLFFIDDYANAIIIGSSMRPLIDRFKVSRAKLAFLVDATSAPVTGLAVISTWIAYEVSLFNTVGKELGISKSGYAMFFDALQFRFYCVLMILFMFIHILMKVDFGPMRKAEQLAETDPPDDNESSFLDDQSNSGQSNSFYRIGRPVSAILPIVGLVAFHLFLLWLSGGGPKKYENIGSLASLSYWQQTISGVSNTSLLLVFSSTFGFVLATICAVFIEKLQFEKIAAAAFAGAKHSLLPMGILILAWSLKSSCDSLKTGKFLAETLQGSVSPFLFPPLLFFIASVTSFATGTSWGTMAILIPTGIPVAYALDGGTYGLTTMISLGAVLDGAIFGDHCSPVSDTTILSSIASKCDLMQHVSTQLPYSLFVATVAMLVGYLPAAMGLNWTETVAIASVVIIIILYVIKKLQKPVLLYEPSK